MNTLRLPLRLVVMVLLGLVGSAWGQTDLDAKAALIDGIAAYRAGASNADSLFALGTGHSLLGAVAEYNLGRSLIATGDTTEAQSAFRRAIGATEDPKLRSSAWHNLGNLHLLSNELDPAISSYKQALREDPANEEARYNLVHAMRMAQQQPPQDQPDEGEDGEQEQEGEDGEQEQEGQDGEQEQDGQDGEQEQEGQDGEQEQEGQDGEQEQDGQDGEQEQEGQDGEQEQEGQDGEQEQEGQDGEQEQDGTAPAEPVEGQISPEDMERILESLERNEAAIQAKLQRQRGAGERRTIEKDW